MHSKLIYFIGLLIVPSERVLQMECDLVPCNASWYLTPVSRRSAVEIVFGYVDRLAHIEHQVD